MSGLSEGRWPHIALWGLTLRPQSREKNPPEMVIKSPVKFFARFSAVLIRNPADSGLSMAMVIQPWKGNIVPRASGFYRKCTPELLFFNQNYIYRFIPQTVWPHWGVLMVLGPAGWSTWYPSRPAVSLKISAQIGSCEMSMCISIAQARTKREISHRHLAKGLLIGSL